MSYIKIIYQEENSKVTVNKVYNYIEKQGIWAFLEL